MNEKVRMQAYSKWQNMDYLYYEPTNSPSLLAPAWKTNAANLVHGYQGTTFPPEDIAAKGDLIVFTPELYRAAALETNGEMAEVNGISLNVYRIKANQLHNSTLNPSNAAFYMDGPSGVAFCGQWSGNASLYMSQPHFLHGSSSLQTAVVGMHPSVALHDTYLAIEPNTGVLMDARKRLQVNVRTLSAMDVSAYSLKPNDVWFASLQTDVYIPLVWFSEHGTVGTASAAQFRSEVYLFQSLAQGIKWGGAAAAVASLSVAAMLFICSITRTMSEVLDAYQLTPLHEPE